MIAGHRNAWIHFQLNVSIANDGSGKRLVINNGDHTELYTARHSFEKANILYHILISGGFFKAIGI